MFDTALMTRQVALIRDNIYGPGGDQADRNAALDRIAASFHPEFVFREAESLPYGGDYRGIEGFKDLRRRMAEVWSDLDANIFDYTASNDRVAVHVLAAFTSRKNGRTLKTQVTEIWTFQEGRIFETAPFYWDTRAVQDLLDMS